MEINEFVAKFAEQFEDTDVSLFTLETNFRELEEWTSLTALSVIAMIDEEYDISLKSDDLAKSETIHDLFIRISNQ